ncbi:MAG TPA: hypothetical protein VEL47_06710 [Myxococcota bacterium]|nr:hypothetical protein [Myxococcota bacterium]
MLRECQLLLIAKGCVLLIALFARCLSADTLDLYFWPTPVVTYESERTGLLYAWPDFKLILQTKDEKSRYAPALVDDALAKKLGILFATTADSPIRIFNDASLKMWGLAIPGGSNLPHVNESFLEAMVGAFVSCLRSLEQNEADRIKEILNAPNSLIARAGEVLLDDYDKEIGNKMYENYRTTRCGTKKAVLPALLETKSRSYLTRLIVGNAETLVPTDGDLLVITTLFHDLLFAKNGLWVRAALGKIREFIEGRMAAYPGINDVSWLAKDYTSYVDAVLLTHRRFGLSKTQYLNLGEICGVDSKKDAFKTCPLKRLNDAGQFSIVNLFIDSLKATFFFRRP